jgi:hypothetical protein
MKPTFFALLGAAFSLSSVTTGYADFRDIEAVFVRAWDTDYTENRCGPNIEQFVARLQREGISIEGAEVVEITNTGGSLFGMLNAERSRTDNPRFSTQERNWFHHVVLLAEGHVFDFDFMDQPTVLPVAEYFERMFLDEIPHPYPPTDYVGRETKLEAYELKLFPAAAYIQRGGRDDFEKIRLGEFLDSPRAEP